MTHKVQLKGVRKNRKKHKKKVPQGKTIEEMKKITTSLISIVTLSMMTMAVVPVFAGKQVPNPSASAYLRQDSLDDTHFYVDITNTGNVPIVLVHLTISGINFVDLGCEKGWKITTFTISDATIVAKGGTIRSGETTTMGFYVYPLGAFTLHWQAWDRKSNIVSQGDLIYSNS